VCRLSKDSWTELENRGVLEVQGADARKFLQGLTTNNMLDLGEEPVTGVYATARVAVAVARFLMLTPPYS